MKWKSSFFFFFLIPFTAFTDEVQVAHRIHNHLLVKDPSSAVEEGRRFLSRASSLGDANFKQVQMAYLEALCRRGEEVEALEQYSLFFAQEENEKNQRMLLEWLAWGVLGKGEESPLLLIRLYSLMGAAFTQDARAIPILLKELRGTNAFLRSLAVKLSMQYGDAPLQKEILRLLKEEKVWFVRLEVIKAVGALRIEEARNTLQEILVNSRALAEEKAAAILSLLNMCDQVSKEELSHLLKSNRAGLRHLGSEIVAHLNLTDEAESLLPLLQDESPDVRISAMNTLGLLKVTTLKGIPVLECIKPNLNSKTPVISITAAWLASVLGSLEGIEKLRFWLEGDGLEAKRVAAAALAATGHFGVSLSFEEINKQKDPYTRANLAIGLIGQRKEVERSSEVLFQVTMDCGDELWMWDDGENPLFRSLVPSRVRHIDEVPRYPEVVDQFTKLEVFSVLSIVKHPKALSAVKNFLGNRDASISGAAAMILLQEGDETALDLIRELLEDSDEKIRVQAALILALVGGDPSAANVLIESYPKVSRDMKLHILEAIGHIGDPSTMSFLLDVLKEPFQGLRVVAASALIQCLYH